MVSGRLIFVSPMQPAKAELPIDVTLSGIVSLSRLVHSLKEYDQML